MSKAVAAVFITLTLTLFFLVLGALVPSVDCTKTGGWLGLVCACCAWYCSAAVVINNTWRQTILPIGVYRHPEKVDSLDRVHALKNV